MGNAYGTVFIDENDKNTRSSRIQTFYTNSVGNLSIWKTLYDLKQIELTAIEEAKKDPTKAGAATTATATVLTEAKKLGLAAAPASLEEIRLKINDLVEIDPLKDIPWDIPELKIYLQQQQRTKYYIPPPPPPPDTSGGGSGGGGGSGSGSGSGSGRSSGPKIVKINDILRTNFMQFKKNVNFPKHASSPELDALKTAVNTPPRDDSKIIESFRKLVAADSSFTTKLIYRMGIDEIQAGGARSSRHQRKSHQQRDSRKHKRIAERQSYRRPRARGIATRKNHRPRQGE